MMEYTGQHCVSANKVKQDWMLARTPFTLPAIQNSTSIFSAACSKLANYIEATRSACAEVGVVAQAAPWFGLSDLGMDHRNFECDSDEILHRWSRSWGEYFIHQGWAILPVDLLSDSRQLEKQQSFFQNYTWLESARTHQPVIVMVSGITQVQQARQLAVFENIFRFCRNGLVPMMFLSLQSKQGFMGSASASFATQPKGFSKKLTGGKYYEVVQARKALGAKRLPAYLLRELKELIK